MFRFISDREIKRQWERVLAQGWLEHFEEGSAESGEAVENLIAIGSRETNLDPKWLTKLGDAGHGAGLMQIDIRSFPTFVNSGEWRDARQGILKGADVLADKRKWIVDNAGKTRKVGKYTFVVPVLSGDALTRCAVASYNCGLWAPYHVSKGRDTDRGTTDSNYSADVMDRAKAFKKLYDAHQPEQVDEPIQNGEVTDGAVVATSTTTTVETAEGKTEEKTSFASSVVNSEKAKEIAGTGLSTIGNKLATGGISGGAMAAIGAFLEKAWPLLIFAAVLIILGFVTWWFIYSAKQRQKIVEGQIAADPTKKDITFGIK